MPDSAIKASELTQFEHLEEFPRQRWHIGIVLDQPVTEANVSVFIHR
jgi:hypothetical protein